MIKDVKASGAFCESAYKWIKTNGIAEQLPDF